MNKYKSLLDVYTEKFKNSTVNERELKKANNIKQNKLFALKKKSAEVEAELRIKLKLGDYNSSSDYTKAENDMRKELMGDVEKEYKKAVKEVEKLTSMYKTSTNLETPKHPPTLSDEYSSMKKGEFAFKSSRGRISPMNHNYKVFDALTNDGKKLYQKISELGNSGEEFEVFRDDIKEYNVSGKELHRVMKLALDMGYKLSDNIYFWLDEISPTLAKSVSNYEGHELSDKDYMNSKHSHYKNIKQQYLTKYDGDESKADRMTKLYRKKKQAESKIRQKYGDTNG